MLPHLLTNFEIQKYYQNEPKFNSVYSRNNLRKIKDGTRYPERYKPIGTYWIALYVNNINVRYFDSFGVEYIPKEIKTFMVNKNITTTFYRIQAQNTTMCEQFCIVFTDFMLKGKSLLDYTDLFSPNKYENNDTKILKYFQ